MKLLSAQVLTFPQPVNVPSAANAAVNSEKTWLTFAVNNELQGHYTVFVSVFRFHLWLNWQDRDSFQLTIFSFIMINPGYIVYFYDGWLQRQHANCFYLSVDSNIATYFQTHVSIYFVLGQVTVRWGCLSQREVWSSFLLHLVKVTHSLQVEHQAIWGIQPFQAEK